MTLKKCWHINQVHGIAISLYTSLIDKQKANKLHLSEQRCLVRARSRCLVPKSAAPGYESATENERYTVQALKKTYIIVRLTKLMKIMKSQLGTTLKP